VGSGVRPGDGDGAGRGRRVRPGRRRPCLIGPAQWVTGLTAWRTPPSPGGSTPTKRSRASDDERHAWIGGLGRRSGVGGGHSPGLPRGGGLAGAWARYSCHRPVIAWRRVGYLFMRVSGTSPAPRTAVGIESGSAPEIASGFYTGWIAVPDSGSMVEPGSRDAAQ
jgi:hypothetical protein